MKIVTMVFKEEDRRDQYIRVLEGDVDVDIVNGPYAEFGIGDAHRRVYILTKQEIENKEVTFGNNRFCILDFDDTGFVNTYLIGTMFPDARVFVDRLTSPNIVKYVNQVDSFLHDKIVRL